MIDVISPWLRALCGCGLGLVFGSFLATIATRWPAGGSAMSGRSRCDDCGNELGPWELFPLVSYLIQRGRCRRCGAAVHPRHPLIELSAGAIGAAVFLAVSEPAMIAAGLWLGGLLLLLAVLDVEHFWLPDTLNLLLLASGLMLSALGLGPPPITSLIGAFLGFGALWSIGFLYRACRGRQGLGAGDPKLLGALGAWLGWPALPFLLLGAGLLGIGIALARRIAGRQVSFQDRLPLGALLAVTGFPLWLLIQNDFLPVLHRTAI